MSKNLDQMINTIAKGDTGLAESFLRRKGGRRYLENIMLILINTVTPHSNEKEEMWCGFVEVLNRMEQRIKRQQEGQQILNDTFSKS
ncbi:MAG TPA: hypothetical protein VEX65_01410 [Flavisolibacter sp.]|jgi:hypothetical protein|nr:hypothetical protein [Flavisolibacter sp.]